LTLANKHIDELLALCLKGNQLAQMEVYNRYYLAMYNIALRILKQTDEAEDSMQEAFLTAFTKLHTFKGEAPFGAWLRRIVVNQSITKFRKIEYNEELEVYKLTDLTDETPEVNGESYSILKANEVLQAIKDLKPNYRSVLTLHYIEGYDYEEIAEIMNISYANSRTMISRAREHLRNKLAEQKETY
jgi:RNA polymerase sigma factor (sigma-70 family)